VRINMDESSVKLDPVRNIPGMVALPKTELKRKAAALVRPASLSLRRAAITLIAFVCDDESTQALLPQVIVGNKRLLPKNVAALHRDRRDNIYVLSRKSGWNNVELQCEIMRLLGKHLAPLHSSHWFLLSMDAFSAHLAPRVADAAHRAGLLLHEIPASLTSLLQPLDTHVFAALKHALWEANQQRLLASSTGEYSARDFVEMVCRVVRKELCHSRPQAFASCGFSPRQQGLTDRVLAALERTDFPDIDCNLPTLDDLTAIWPARMQIPIIALFRRFTQQPASVRERTDVLPATEETVPNPASPPLRHRLRSSSSRLKLEADKPGTHCGSSEAAEPAVPALPCPTIATASASAMPPPRRLPIGRPLQPRRLRCHRQPPEAAGSSKTLG